MTAPIINVGLVSNVFVRQMHFAAVGDSEVGHKHRYDHMTLLAKGQLRVTVNGQATDYTAPMMIFIRANLVHELECLSENTVAYCIHGLRDADKSDDIVSPDMVPRGVVLRSMIAQVIE